MQRGTGGDGPVQGSPDIPGYTDLLEIGRGGFATVYRARRTAFGQDVAIKVLAGGGLDPDTIARFDRERTAMGVLAQHPHIVTVYDGGIADGRPYLVMEFLPRGSLDDELRRAGPAPVPTVLDIGVKVCGALETAHRAGVLHRDVKPPNVLISPYGEPLLADFGIARISGAKITASGVVTASLAHAPPEVVDGREPSAVSDVYSLASTLFCLLTGSAPFARGTDESVAPLLARLFREPVPDLRPNGVPDALCAVLERAMAKDPATRPPTARALGEQLQQVQERLGSTRSGMVVEGAPRAGGVLATRVDLAGPTVSSAPRPAPDRPRGRFLWLGAAAACVSIAVGWAALLVFTDRDTTDQAVGAGSPPSAAGSPVISELEPVLLDFAEFDPTGRQLDDSPLWGLSAVLYCPGTADDSGKVDEVSRSLQFGPDSSIFLDTYVARFAPGAAATFVTSLRSTAERCAGNGSVDPPEDIVPPPGGDEAIRVTVDTYDAIWVRRGDYLVSTLVRFSSGPDVDTVTAPDLAARATAKLVQAVS